MSALCGWRTDEQVSEDSEKVGGGSRLLQKGAIPVTALLCTDRDGAEQLCADDKGARN